MDYSFLLPLLLVDTPSVLLFLPFCQYLLLSLFILTSSLSLFSLLFLAFSIPLLSFSLFNPPSFYTSLSQSHDPKNTKETRRPRLAIDKLASRRESLNVEQHACPELSAID